jgi:multidrug efflux pump subunit AcrA (membrane-fusion protein)
MAFISENNTAHQVAIQVGQERGFALEVKSGLHEGDLLICDGLQRLAAGTNLNTVPALIALAGK